ncbi:unknown [Clostridium sp. CAG:299]|nr:unknown [Clostridium sp. CAG:299]
MVRKRARMGASWNASPLTGVPSGAYRTGGSFPCSSGMPYSSSKAHVSCPVSEESVFCASSSSSSSSSKSSPLFLRISFSAFSSKSSGSSSSPSIMQEPPNGRSFSEYLVSPLLKLISLGPIPRENSRTQILPSFANRKWPNSWNKIISPNTRTAASKLNNLPPALSCFMVYKK